MTQNRRHTPIYSVTNLTGHQVPLTGSVKKTTTYPPPSRQLTALTAKAARRRVIISPVLLGDAYQTSPTDKDPCFRPSRNVSDFIPPPIASGFGPRNQRTTRTLLGNNDLRANGRFHRISSGIPDGKISGKPPPLAVSSLANCKATSDNVVGGGRRLVAGLSRPFFPPRREDTLLVSHSHPSPDFKHGLPPTATFKIASKLQQWQHAVWL